MSIFEAGPMTGGPGNPTQWNVVPSGQGKEDTPEITNSEAETTAPEETGQMGGNPDAAQ